MDREKSNPVASVNKPPLEIPAEATFMDGSHVTADGGGVVVSGGKYYTVARREMVPNGEPTMRTAEGWAVPANRSGSISILEHTTSQPTTYGAELEGVRLNADGSYAELSPEELLKINELYTFMTEAGTKPTDDPEEFRQRYWDMVHQMVAEAEAVGQYAVSLAVFGQHEPRPNQLNPSPYVAHVAATMGTLTGFDTVQMFRTGGAQPHTGMSNTEAAIKAAEAMQYLNPILMAPTLSGPRVAGGMAGNLAQTQFTTEQREHMRRMGVTNEDLSKPYQSWRYMLRRLGSPSAGIWLKPAPDSMESYLAAGHEKLTAGEINNIDRANGWHADRVRMVLDGSGANTLEGCEDDPALGNPNTLVPLHFLRSALATVLEKKAMEGADPRLVVAEKLGTMSLSRQARLDLAHHYSLREVSRYGTDALVYGGKTPGQWLSTLLDLADAAPFTYVNDKDELRLRDMFTGKEETEKELSRWCANNHTNMPTAQAYFDLGLNNPAFYMDAQYRYLRKEHPERPKETLMRQVELDAAKALHHASQQAQRTFQS